MKTYECEECKKKFKAKSNKYSHWVRCECGGKAFDVNGNYRTSPMTKFWR